MRRRACSRIRRPPRSGHTLWEVLLVLALLGTVGAIVEPALRVTGPVRADNDVVRTTQELTDLLARARLTALERGTAVELVVDPTAARVWVLTGSGDSLQLAETMTLTRAAGIELVASTPRARFVFDPSGIAYGSQLLVRGPGGTRRVSLDPWSGEAHVAER